MGRKKTLTSVQRHICSQPCCIQPSGLAVGKKQVLIAQSFEVGWWLEHVLKDSATTTLIWKSWLSIEGKSVYMFTSTCVNTQGKERGISIWKCQMWLTALKLRQGWAQIKRLCWFGVRLLLSLLSWSYFRPSRFKDLLGTTETHLSFSFYRLYLPFTQLQDSTKRTTSIPSGTFQAMFKDVEPLAEKIYAPRWYSNKLCPAIWKSSFLCTCMHFKRKSTRGSKTRLNHICLGLNYIVCRVQSCFLSTKKTHPAVFYLKFLPLSKKCFHWPSNIISRSWAS